MASLLPPHGRRAPTPLCAILGLRFSVVRPIMNEEQLITYGVPAIGGAGAAFLILMAVRAGRRRRLLTDMPTCKTLGVFMGLVELAGTAEAETPLVGFLSERNCVYFTWSVNEHWSRTVIETYTDDQGRIQTRTRTESGSTTVASGGDETDFYLRDDCGVVLVRPHKAKIEPLAIVAETCGPSDPLYYAKGPPGAVSDSTFVRDFTEHAIPLHAPLYVVGYARERQDVVAPEIAYDKRAEMFLISTRTERQVSRGFAWRSRLLGVLGVAVGSGGFIAGDAGLNRPVEDLIPKHLAVAGGFAGLWLVGWIWIAFTASSP